MNQVRTLPAVAAGWRKPSVDCGRDWRQQLSVGQIASLINNGAIMVPYGASTVSVEIVDPDMMMVRVRLKDNREFRGSVVDGDGNHWPACVWRAGIYSENLFKRSETEAIILVNAKRAKLGWVIRPFEPADEGRPMLCVRVKRSGRIEVDVIITGDGDIDAILPW